VSTADRASATLARLAAIGTELSARRELRDRGQAAASAAAQDSVKKIGPVAEKVAEHLGELGRRQREAGGWATQKTLADKEPVFGFDPEEDEPADAEYARYTAPVEDKEEDTIGVLAEPDDHRSEPGPPREAAPSGAAEPGVSRPAPRRRAPVHEAEDDDFSNMSSWLKK
jgi:hypothetical protein